MSSSKRYLTHALGTLVIGATLVFTAPVGADDSTTIDFSAQPHLKSWSNIIPNAAKRFLVLADFNNEAVLDRETGLVWERSPLTGGQNWSDARLQCTSRTTGNRKGWRLPSVHELASLVDPSVPFLGPTIPAGHPFLTVAGWPYWSASTNAETQTDAWIVAFQFGTVFANRKSLDIPNVWCVRGGMQESLY